MSITTVEEDSLKAEYDDMLITTNDAGEDTSCTEEHTGGSSSYYDLTIGDTTIKCLDIIEGLDMSYNEGNILKAVWRIAAAKQGKKKKGNNMHYDSEKIVFFGERLLEEHKEDV